MVSTPIGNLEDMTLRAIRILKEVDLIAAEDTRRSKVLLRAHGISGALTSFHSYNLKRKTPRLIETLLGGRNIALISDSGTPGISDPGSALIGECIKNDIPIAAVPGPTAFVAALVLSGRPTHKFIFEGFLSNRGARRRRQLESLKGEERTVIIYESPHRIIKFLEDFLDILGDREVVLAREITKKFEEIRREKASRHLEHFSKINPRGEFIVVF
ncbi:MAG: 16S rRNA (cytidine(1402)-2'-O)-methyltransferase [Candidatus Makaraimicrobium thalassicum]|nr:MAG: 16S rRNA (cytidine(1402)-2'-O)-methyltransferase [Candidatus Omnitrophota bacterium]